VLGLSEAPLPLLVQEEARSRIVEIRDVRQPGIGDRAAEGDEVSGPARALGFHDAGALNGLTWRVVS
jgi:hypothetical protein